MKSILFAAAIAAAAMSTAQAQDAAPVPKCLRTMDIRDTTTPNDKTIIFHMNNGKVWHNDLRGTCSGLTFNGFRYDVTPPDEICGNQQIIHVLRTHAVCALGPFSAEPPKSAAPGHM
jgi:opacity protein-like surface antigen